MCEKTRDYDIKPFALSHFSICEPDEAALLPVIGNPFLTTAPGHSFLISFS